MKRYSLVVSIMLSAALFGTAISASAAMIEFTFSGIANFATAPNTSFSGDFTYDTTTPPEFPGSPNYQAVTDAQLTIFGATYTWNVRSIGITNDFLGQDEMTVALGRYPDTSLAIPIPGGSDVFNTVRITLTDTTGTMFSDTSLPQDLSFLAHVNLTTVGFSNDVMGGGINGKAFTDNVTLQARILPAIPEPGTMLLLGSGLGVIGLAAWRRRK